MNRESVVFFSIIVKGCSDRLEEEGICEQLVAILTDLSRQLGTYLEPEQELEIGRVDSPEFSYEISPVFRTLYELKPEPLFYQYARIMMRCFESILNGQALFDHIQELERLRGSFLEMESESLFSGIKSTRKKIKGLGVDVDFTYRLSKEAFYKSSNIPCLEEMVPVCEKKEFFLFQNYEFEYELVNFVFKSTKPSRLQMGGRSHEVFFDDEFIEELCVQVDCEGSVIFDRDITREFPSFKPEDCSIKNLSFSANVPSIFRYKKNEYEIFFSKDFLSKFESVFRAKVGRRILLKDRYEKRKIGEFFRGEFYQTGVRKDKRTCFEFISRTC